MVKVKIISGPRAGQTNIVEMKPQDLIGLANKGWRWVVEYITVPEGSVFEWARQDLACKTISCLVGGREVIPRLPNEPDQKWSRDFSEQLALEIEDAVVYSGYNITVEEDSENTLVISGVSPESPTVQ